MTSGRPLESVLKHPKLLDTNSRNIGDDIGIFIINKINVANRTMDWGGTTEREGNLKLIKL